MVSNRVGKLKFRQVKIRLFRKGIRKWRCKSFVRLFRKGSFCPVCLKVYRIEEDHVNPMVMCDRCDRWIHTGLSVISNIFLFSFFLFESYFSWKICTERFLSVSDCDGIDENRYNELSKDQGATYTCILCRGEKEERMDSFHKKNRWCDSKPSSSLFMF